MKLTLAEPKYLKDSISIISDLVSEGSFKVTSDAIELVAMDPANVAMVIFKLFSSAFAEYQVDKPTELAINLNNLKQILRRAGTADTLTLETDANKLKITLRGVTKRTFSLPIIDMESKEQRIPELRFGASIKAPAQVLNSAVEDVDIVGESVSFGVEQDIFTVAAEGDLSKAHIEIKKDENTTINMHDPAAFRSKYSIEYLKKMIAGSKLSDEVLIQFNKDYPLRLDYKDVDKVSLTFILAPRVEND